MVGDVGEAASVIGTEVTAMNVDTILRDAREVIVTSRASRAHACVLHARFSLAAAKFAASRRRFGCDARPAPPLMALSGGAGLLDHVRVLVVTDDVDTRDLMKVLLEWYGAEVVRWSAPRILLVELPFERDGAFTLARALRTMRDGNGGTPRLVALTRHQHDHPESQTLGAGFDAQIPQPVDPLAFEQALVALLRPVA
jgi:CheY-like chemotaxis protein